MSEIGLWIRTTEEPVLVVTGFGPFGDVTSNPTAMIIHELKQLKSQDLCQSFPVQILGVLEVSITGVEKFLESTRYLFSTGAPRCFIHLGVDSGSKGFKLERKSFNNSNFRIPDALGHQPESCKIDNSQELDSPLCCSFDIEAALQTLQGEGFNVSASDDPGRYLCNYVYYRSSQVATRCVIFIHCPPFEEISMDNQVLFIRRAIALLSEQTLRSS